MSNKELEATKFAKLLRYLADCIEYASMVSSFNDCITCGVDDCHYNHDLKRKQE